ncbi:hypothetical protein B6N60_00540 [Richelia sinica FACHB-800]|uniref:Uncharacterized protein n=1 Tax=Richelia sinica FACHB-800 TaxID=1357546 RepID=A0A975T492_9NOST|nr:hypothetical protein [Richelia sinica]MBD2663010.1 hypothetical protein [Richelia sinica FACHB-800]QXE21862.1 hypothetical protein B6N60_00540 [Richelia sinica FACHB-800]
MLIAAEREYHSPLAINSDGCLLPSCDRYLFSHPKTIIFSHNTQDI